MRDRGLLLTPSVCPQYNSSAVSRPTRKLNRSLRKVSEQQYLLKICITNYIFNLVLKCNKRIPKREGKRSCKGKKGYRVNGKASCICQCGLEKEPPFCLIILNTYFKFPHFTISQVQHGDLWYSLTLKF